MADLGLADDTRVALGRDFVPRVAFPLGDDALPGFAPVAFPFADDALPGFVRAAPAEAEFVFAVFFVLDADPAAGLRAGPLVEPLSRAADVPAPVLFAPAFLAAGFRAVIFLDRTDAGFFADALPAAGPLFLVFALPDDTLVPVVFFAI